MTTTRKVLYSIAAIVVIATFCEAMYAFFFISDSIPSLAGRIGEMGWRIGESILGEKGGHVGYGAIVLLISATVAYGLYQDFTKQHAQERPQ